MRCRVMDEMSLLTDRRLGTRKLVKFLIRWERPLSILLYLIGIVWLLLFALPEFNDKTYFSENALLPGLVTKETNLEQTSKQFYQELVREMKRYPDGMPYAWLAAKFNQLHLDVFIHNFSLIYPFQNQNFTGQNIYGIVRAPRGSRTEAIVVSVPFRPINSIYLDTAPSVALLLAFAKFCRRQKYWAKDIIFLITEHEQLGMQAWLDAYHGVISGKEGILLPGDLSGRAGSIQAAVNLELHAMKVSSIDVKIEGLNGQLPNLDLFNLAQNMIAQEGIRHSFQRRFDVHYKNKLKNWWYHFNTLGLMIATQATGVPTGNHGLFHRYGIEAITLEAFEDTGRGSTGNFYQVGRVVESIVRSLNNLLERFHQSYFFYLLPSTDNYISIGLYIKPLTLIVAGLLIKAFSMWQNIQFTSIPEKVTPKKATPEKTTSEKETPEKETPEKETPDEQKKEKEKEENKEQELKLVQIEEFDIGSVSSEILWAHTCGALIMSSPGTLTKLGKSMWNLRTEDSIFFGFAFMSLLTLLWPLYFRRRMKYNNMALVCIVACVELATSLTCIAMHNFSLALVASIAYAPVVLPIMPKKQVTSRFRSILYVLWILFHPFVVSSLTVMAYTYVNFPTDSLLPLLARGYRAVRQAYVFSIMDSMIYGNWLYNVTVSVMLPVWLLFWNVLCSSTIPHS